MFSAAAVAAEVEELQPDLTSAGEAPVLRPSVGSAQLRLAAAAEGEEEHLVHLSALPCLEGAGEAEARPEALEELEEVAGEPAMVPQGEAVKATLGVPAKELQGARTRELEEEQRLESHQIWTPN